MPPPTRPAPGLTPEEIDAIVSETYPGDSRGHREEAEQRAEDAVEQMVEDMLAPDEETGLTPRVARYPRVDEPSPGYGWAPPRPTRSNAMALNFARIYGAGAVAEFQANPLQDALQRLGTVTIEGSQNFRPPPLNSVWQHRELPALQMQVTRTTEDECTLRPIGTYRPALPRLVSLSRACFYSWFVPLEDIHMAVFEQAWPPVRVEPKPRKPSRKKPRVKPEPKPAPTIWERILSDEDDKD